MDFADLAGDDARGSSDNGEP